MWTGKEPIQALLILAGLIVIAVMLIGSAAGTV